MRKAIVVYVDDKKNNLEEFSWLYKTWLLWNLDEEYDIVAYSNPEAIEKLPKHPSLIIKSLNPLNVKDSVWEYYGFVNSFAMFNNNEECIWIENNYTHILKTDCDVFLTKNLLGLSPEKILIGEGDYMGQKTDEILTNLLRVKEKLGLNYNDLNHIGASVFGPTKYISQLIKHHYTLTEYILKTEFKENIGAWPGWYKGVASMYAIHLAVNDMFSRQHVKLYTLDEKCWGNEITKDVYHIHAWHSNIDFSKHKWFRGEYEKYVCDKIPTKAKDYCLWVVSNTLDELIEIKSTLE